jgi:hypothetical protein
MTDGGEVESATEQLSTAEKGTVIVFPDDVHSKEQVACLPSHFVSGCRDRPLRCVDLDGSEYQHALQPLLYSIPFVLLFQAFERFACKSSVDCHRTINFGFS